MSLPFSIEIRDPEGRILKIYDCWCHVYIHLNHLNLKIYLYKLLMKLQLVTTFRLLDLVFSHKDTMMKLWLFLL